MAKYDAIGKTYDHTRRADPRIAGRLIAALNLPAGAAVADIGAGTGNYSYELAAAGYQVQAVEPSTTMQQQGKQHPRLHWLTGTAEAIPLADGAMDGVVCTLAVHHFRDLAPAFREMVRVVAPGGPLVLFVSDPRLTPPDLWLADYFGPIYARSQQAYPPTDEVVRLLAAATGSAIEVEPFPLPHDLQDRFFASGWRHPEYYLDPLFRAGVSPLASAPAAIVEPLVAKLAHDLADGTWQQRYGHVLTWPACEAGYRFLIGRKARPAVLRATSTPIRRAAPLHGGIPKLFPGCESPWKGISLGNTGMKGLLAPWDRPFWWQRGVLALIRSKTSGSPTGLPLILRDSERNSAGGTKRVGNFFRNRRGAGAPQDLTPGRSPRISPDSVQE